MGGPVLEQKWGNQCFFLMFLTYHRMGGGWTHGRWVPKFSVMSWNPTYSMIYVQLCYYNFLRFIKKNLIYWTHGKILWYVLIHSGCAFLITFTKKKKHTLWSSFIRELTVYKLCQLSILACHAVKIIGLVTTSMARLTLGNCTSKLRAIRKFTRNW